MTLPLELLLAIAHFLPQNALPAFARTSSTFALLTQRVLYRHLTPSSSARSLSLISLLARKPHIARHVRSFHLAIDHAVPVFFPFYSLLALALRNMSDLHSLHLLLDDSPTWVLCDAAPKNLVHFTSSFSLDENVVRFLHLTPSLRELELDSAPTTSSPSQPLPSLPETSIPRLEQFIGSCRAASLIVPGRPVTSIHLNASILPEDHIPLLARSTAKVLVLAAVTNSSLVSFLPLLHRHLPHLAFLRVTSSPHHLCQPPSPEYCNQVISLLDSFSELSTAELAGIHWGSHRKHDDSKRVWQSPPLLCTTLPNHVYPSEFFLAY